RLQTFRHLHACSGCFRLERSPGGTCTHWKAPPLHGSHPKQTFVLQHDGIKFAPWAGLPPGSGEMAKLYGDLDAPGPYLVLMKWNPGWFSAPHSYATDRIQ